ncbi:membrane protein [gut metagenome]|uniref:Membrane protein n=1 Tax=gut metagenome TaxID=749906 RepID=J9C545_9ZZZZ
MTDTYLTIVSYRTGDAECLKTFTDVLSSLYSVLSLLLERNSRTYNVSPLCVLEADHLGAFALLIRIKTILFANLVSLFNIFDTVLVKSSKNLLNATVLAFKLYFSNHVMVLLLVFTWID